ncbi:MAG: hypothetical protein E4G90_10015 [Gemmatimonadales bacterium]|nr:MAG: hypothetical protein E4G90_10015 [Gemmatimonadales bacterium]
MGPDLAVEALESGRSEDRRRRVEDESATEHEAVSPFGFGSLKDFKKQIWLIAGAIALVAVALVIKLLFL